MYDWCVTALHCWSDCVAKYAPFAAQLAKDISSLPGSFWCLCLVCFFGFPAIGTLSTIAPAYLTKYYSLIGMHQSQRIQNLGTLTAGVTQIVHVCVSVVYAHLQSLLP